MKSQNTKYKIWLCILLSIIALFIIIGLSFRVGVMVGNNKCLSNSVIIDSFYSSAWAVYTTIFGIFGVVMGIVFPLYQNNSQQKKFEKETEEINDKLDEVYKTKADLIEFKEKYETTLNDLKATSEKVKKEVNESLLYSIADDMTKDIRRGNIKYENVESILKENQHDDKDIAFIKELIDEKLPDEYKK